MKKKKKFVQINNTENIKVKKLYIAQINITKHISTQSFNKSGLSKTLPKAVMDKGKA